ncbi:fibrinogen alpha chain-like [Astyanax mexicanus]|uniref:Fibrinogen alpha chain-like n=1 Tax=Astyanax mexicanus TaxID=7994 RepID=A0A8T2KYK4_ASTMX|nr:fibrinogen alpha chain-like [Astyanax mexicanus]
MSQHVGQSEVFICVVLCLGESDVCRDQRKMNLQHSLLYLCVVISSALSQNEESPGLGPRGARPIEHGYKADKCATEKEWPICTDEDWGRKCPSGCRIQGLLDTTDHELLSKIQKIRKLLDEGKKMHRSADQVSKETYNYLRERLVSGSDNDNRFADLAEQLRQRIVEMKIKIDRQLKVLEALKSQVKKQVIAMQRLEVDIDIKLRSCKGSCASYAEFSVDKESYVALDKQLDRLDTMQVQSVETVSSLRVMKSRPMKDVVVPSIYKSGMTGTDRAEQKKPLFTDVGQIQLSLEAEGSTAKTPLIVSKVPTGTGPIAPSTSGVSCTKTVRKVVTHTKDGLQEKYETVSSGGPGCDNLQKLGLSERDSKSITTFSRGDADLGDFGGDFFKQLGTGGSSSSSTFSSSSSSSSSSKTILTGGSKGFVSNTKTVLSTSSPFGDDLGAFLNADVEDDLPDIHARSLKSRDERKDGFVGGVCGSKRSIHSQKRPSGQQGRFEQCPANKYPMCTDEEEESKCPSGCRMQGLLDKLDDDIHERLHKICKNTQKYNHATSSTMLQSAQFYEAQRKILIKTYMQELRYADGAQRLHRNLTLLSERSSKLFSELQRYHSQILEQITEMHRLEVDIDIKLRACKGSCKQTFDHTIDHQTFKTMEDHMARFDLSSINQEPFTLDKKIKLQPVVRPPVSLTYRKIPLVRSRLLTKFEDIEQNQVVLDELLDDISNSGGQ